MRLEGAHRALERHTTEALLKLEAKLGEEWKEILLQEEMIWMQKSRVDWLKSGDGNTKFLHTLTLIKMIRSTIEILVNEDGEWVEGKENLKNMALSFYYDMFSLDPSTGGEFIKGHFPHLSEDVRSKLEAEFLLAETSVTLKSMGSLNAPGPDGY